MADSKLSALTALAVEPDATDQLYVNDGGVSKRIAYSVLEAAICDTTNVTAAGALMDSEVTNLAAVKAFDPADYATAAQGVQSIVIACSDETTALTTGDGKATFRMPYAFTVSEVRASVTTAPTGAGIIVDITESGTSILSTLITIDATTKTSESAGTPPVISDASLADDAEIQINIDQIGASVAGAGLKVTLIGTRT